jgi:hypothetical protein
MTIKRMRDTKKHPSMLFAAYAGTRTFERVLRCSTHKYVRFLGSFQNTVTSSRVSNHCESGCISVHC